ncbi:hypothetical protein RSOLAG22IIIB_08538 [Rhizoctonia solani]|uniref:Uncharacterized protein n=1 Tax=Rhizoctonia solani TaxID=456999 RepID=A0A0K6FTG6_9AGAM|nr:hypothetical protein RSOLAG22IIIB_08538 [Rhizoctonia solani]
MDVNSGMSLEVQDNGEEYDIKVDLEEAEEELDDSEGVAYGCDKFSKLKGNHYIAARFLDVRVVYKFVGSPRIEVFPPSAPIASELPSTGCLHLIGRAHPGLILDDTELEACVQQVSKSSDLRLPVAVYWMNRMGPDPVDHRKLGVHPLGLFTLFIHNSDYDELFDSDYDSSILDDLVIVNDAVRAVRATNAQLTRRKTSDQTQASDWSTITYLNIAKLTKSTGVPRPISQKTVMYGHSASEGRLRVAQVAEIFRWTRENRPRTMWHRAEVKNLIFGSVETNTSMIRAETTMKRLATQLSQEIPSKSEANFGVITTSTKPLPNFHPGTNCAWLTSELKYCMRLRISQISPKLEDLENELYFNPFSRSVPLAFELRLDEVVEKAWLKRELAKAGFDYEKHNDIPPHLRNAGQEVVKFCHYFINANSRQFDWDRFHNEVQARPNDIVIERPSYLHIPRTRTPLQPLSQEIANALSETTLHLLQLPNFITHAFSHLQENAKLGYADHEQGRNYSAFTYRLLLLLPQSGLNQFNLSGAIIIIKLISDAFGEEEWYGLNGARYCNLAAEVEAVGFRVSRDFVAVPGPM